MADYSGYWSCSECPANGDAYSKSTPHAIDCSIYLKQVQAAVDAKRKKIEALQAKQQEQKLLSEMTRDEFFEWLWKKERESGELHSALTEVNRECKAGRANLRERNGEREYVRYASGKWMEHDGK